MQKINKESLHNLKMLQNIYSFLIHSKCRGEYHDNGMHRMNKECVDLNLCKKAKKEYVKSDFY